MEEVIDAIYIFRRIYLNIDKAHLNKSKKTLWLENGRSSIHISRTKRDDIIWKIHFKLPDVLIVDRNSYFDLSIYPNTEELSYIFGLKDVPGNNTTKRMILYSTNYFLRFENYLGIFSRDLCPIACLSLNEYIRDAVKRLLEL